MMADTAAGRLARAEGLPALLDAASEVFEHLLLVTRGAGQQGADGLLPWLVLAAAAAADGRDALLGAPSMPAASLAPQPAAPPLVTAARYAGGVARQLQARLSSAPASDPADRAACAVAAACASRVAELLVPPG